MVKKDRVYVIFLIAVIAIFVVFQMAQKQPEDWTPTFHNQQDIPFGTELLHELIPDLFEGQSVESVFRTVYELVELDSIDENILIVAEGFACDKNDLKSILSYVSQGHSMLIGAYEFEGALADSLKLTTQENISFSSLDVPSLEKILGGDDQEVITFRDEIETKLDVPFLVAASYFDQIENEALEVVATNSTNDPVILKYAVGEGAIYLTTMPLAFTNYMAINENARPLTEALLSLLPANTPILHNEYYQLGRLESQTPLRVLLSNPALRTATYITLITFLLLIVFDSKRKQRVIPVIAALRNTSLEFAGTLGQLYYRQSDHNKLAKKRMKYWIDHINRNYNLRPGELDKEFRQELEKKSGASEQVCRTLVEHFRKVEAGGAVPAEELVSIEKTLNEFYRIN